MSFVDEKQDFSKFGKNFQENLAQLILDDRVFCDQISEVLDVNFLELNYLRVFVQKIFDYRKKYGTHPSHSTIATILRSDIEKENDVLKRQIREYYARQEANNFSVEGAEHVKDVSLDFCKKQKLKEAMIKSVGLIQNASYDEVSKVINDALKLGNDNDLGYDYLLDFERRFELKARKAVSTGWDLIDGITRGGIGRGELGVIVAPTGCHAKGTKILMSNKIFNNVEDIVVGDKLFGPDGKERNVLALHRGHEEMFSIEPICGKSFVVNKGHILSLMDGNNNVKNISVAELLENKNHKEYDLYGIDPETLKVWTTPFKINPSGFDDYYGFEVDADNLYVMEDFFVTHNSGKSMALVHLGAAALKQGLNVVYYSLELGDQVIGSRFDSCLTGFPLSNLGDYKEHILDTVKEIKGKLIIKEYPTKSATTNTIKHHLEKLQRKDIKIDMVIVDYGDLLRPVSAQKEKRNELESIYEELRGLSQEFNCCLWTASQSNRSGLNAEIVTLESISEAFNKCFVADFICTISRTVKDKNTNEGRIFVAKNRNGPDGLIFPIFMDTSNVKIKVLQQTGESVEDLMAKSTKDQARILRDKYKDFKQNG